MQALIVSDKGFAPQKHHQLCHNHRATRNNLASEAVLAVHDVVGVSDIKGVHDRDEADDALRRDRHILRRLTLRMQRFYHAQAIDTKQQLTFRQSEKQSHSPLDHWPSPSPLPESHFGSRIRSYTPLFPSLSIVCSCLLNNI